MKYRVLNIISFDLASLILHWKLRSLNICVASAVLVLLTASWVYAATESEVGAVKKHEVKNSQCVFTAARYENAIRLLRLTREFQDVKKQALTTEKSRAVYLGSTVDTPIWWRDSCHESVTVYLDRRDRLELRLSFLVNTKKRTLFVQDLNGEYKKITLVQAEIK